MNSPYRNLWSRGEVFRYMFAKPSPTEEHAMKKTAAYAQMHKEVKTELFVYDKATKQAIGIAGLKEMKPSVYTVTDIALCPDFHGKGYGKQILNAFMVQLVSVNDEMHEHFYGKLGYGDATNLKLKSKLLVQID